MKKKEIYHIVVIGVGNLGSRHLQALKKIKKNVIISVVDPNLDSLETAKKRYFEIPENENIKKIFFLNNISELSHDIDVAIIATNSDVRRKVIEELVATKSVKNFVLEKVLFQQVEDYYEILNLFQNKQIKSWVNCPRRFYDFYYDVKKYVKSKKIFSVEVSGSNWGLGCNSIHYIDLVAFLSEDDNYNVQISIHDKFDSKRKGYIEFSGEMTANFKKGTILRLKSFSNGLLPTTISIFSEDARIIIDETNGKLFLSRLSNNWLWENYDFRIPFQSEITQLIVEEIIEHGNCNLTPFSESIKLHLPMINSFLNVLNNEERKGEVIKCPIT